MPDRLTTLHVVGARPNFMKMAPLLEELESREGFRNVLVHTGQHYDPSMSQAFFGDLQIPNPDHNLGVGSGTHAAQTAAVMSRLEPVLLKEDPDLLVVVGDVNSTVAASLTAAKMGIPVAHVEAGLRSGDRTMPEEINRILTDQLSDILLTHSPDANHRLQAEGIPDTRIHLVGNVMIDSLLRQLQRARSLGMVRRFKLERRAFVLATLHSPTNVDDPDQLEEIFLALDDIASEMPVIFPMHPRTAVNARRYGLHPQRATVLPPLGYLEMIGLMEKSAAVLTDSGGIQEETTAVGVPCLTLRSSTERPITVEEGTNHLVPIRSRERIVQAFREAMETPTEGRCPALWDGRAAGRIADVFEAWASGRRAAGVVSQGPDTGIGRTAVLSGGAVRAVN